MALKLRQLLAPSNGLRNLGAFFALFHLVFPFVKPLKDELVVARNRFLAESMLNGVSGNKSPAPHAKYSVPTCHSTLKQMEQARLAREFEQQRQRNLFNNNNCYDETDHYHLPRVKRTLSRTSSVGKLVNNFENGNLPNGPLGGLPSAYINKPPKPPLAAKPSLRHTVSPWWRQDFSILEAP